MIIDYDFLSYVIFDQQFKITFRKSSSPPLKKSTPPFLLTPPPPPPRPPSKKIKKCKPPPPPPPSLFGNIENFSGPPRGKTLCLGFTQKKVLQLQTQLMLNYLFIKNNIFNT